MRTDVISAEPGLIAIRDEWSALCSRCPYATPFQTPEWLIPWWQSFGEGHLRVVTVRRGDALTGLFPYFIGGSPPKLMLMGYGISDYLDILVDPFLREKTMASMFDYLLNAKDEWESGDFRDVRDESPLLTAAVPHEIFLAVEPSSVCPVCVLPATAEAFHAGLSGRQRRHIRSAFKKAGEKYRIGIVLAGENTLDESLDDLVRLHSSCWKERALPGVLSDARIAGFHRRAAAGLLRRGLLYLYRIIFDEITVASIYAIKGNDCMYSYIGGFDPAFGDFSPGMIALDLVIGDSIRNGIREFDFLRGAERYKYAWGAENRQTRRLTLRPSVFYRTTSSEEACA